MSYSGHRPRLVAPLKTNPIIRLLLLSPYPVFSIHSMLRVQALSFPSRPGTDSSTDSLADFHDMPNSRSAGVASQ